MTTACSPSGTTVRHAQYTPFSQIPGISTHLDVCKDPSDAAGMAACAFQLGQLKAAGVVLVRTDFTWADIEPEQGTFTWTSYDSLVNAVVGSGLQLDAILDFGNAWADAEGSSAYPPDDPQTFADFAYHVALHYKGRIHLYEIWNEQNTFKFWPPKENPKAYGALLEAAYTAIKSADPDALVAFGGVYMWNWAGATTGGAAFLDQTLTQYPSLGKYMDAVAFHPYPHYPPSTAPDFTSSTQESLDQMCGDVESVLAKHGVSKPLWITEICWPTYPPVDEGMQARWLVRTYMESVEQGIVGVYWYDFIDGTNCSIPQQECYFGLFDYSAAPSDADPPRAKQSFYALKAMDSILSGTTFNADVSAQFGLIGAQALYFTTTDGSKRIWVFFARHGTPARTVSVPMKGMTFYDISGTTFTPPGTGAGYALTVTTSPVYAVK